MDLIGPKHFDYSKQKAPNANPVVTERRHASTSHRTELLSRLANLPDHQLSAVLALLNALLPSEPPAQTRTGETKSE